jgi:hypothetical protein
MTADDGNEAAEIIQRGSRRGDGREAAAAVCNVPILDQLLNLKTSQFQSPVTVNACRSMTAYLWAAVETHE